MYIYMYIYIYIYLEHVRLYDMYLCAFVYLHGICVYVIFTYIRARVICTCVRLYTCMHVGVFLFISMCTRARKHTYACIRLHMYTYR